MIAFELAAAIAALAVAPQYIEPDRYSATARPGNQTSPRAAAAHAKPDSQTGTRMGRKADRRQTRNRKPVANCGTSHKGYDARTSTYRDARGKRQNCPR